MTIETRRQSGAVDEIVANGVDVHLERCNAGMWFLSITEPDGTSLAIWLERDKRSIRIATEERAAPLVVHETAIRDPQAG
jgi:phenolic acid decarboxylase